MGFYDAFFGSDQSLYTAYAIIAAIISICVTILFTSTDIPIGSRLLMILFVVITLVPSIFLTLFEITCIVTGGTEPNNWWCYTFGWILAAFIIIYCVFVVIISIVSLVTYNKAIDNVNNDEQKNKVNPKEANDLAKQIMATQQPTHYPTHAPTQKPVEKFYDAPDMAPQLQQAPNMNITDDSNNILSLNGTGGSFIKAVNQVMEQTNPQQMNSDIANFSGSVAAHPASYVSTKTDTNKVPEHSTSKFTDIAPFSDNSKFSDFGGNGLVGTEGDYLGGYPAIFNTK
jgi:uncharacterized membrane protein